MLSKKQGWIGFHKEKNVPYNIEYRIQTGSGELKSVQATTHGFEKPISYHLNKFKFLSEEYYAARTSL